MLSARTHAKQRGHYSCRKRQKGIDVFRALEARPLEAKIAAVLLDLTMPGMNGEEIQRQRPGGVYPEALLGIRAHRKNHRSRGADSRPAER